MTLIQSRVISRAFSADDMKRQEECVNKHLTAGMQLVELEPYEAGMITAGRAPKDPFILALTNDRHRGSMPYPECNNIDLSHMAGLILPEYLRGGMLAHDGYRFIAYALYWGLPIAMIA